MIAICVLYVVYQTDESQNALLADGTSLARVISSIGSPQATREAYEQNTRYIERIFEHQLRHPGFAYGLISEDGVTSRVVTNPNLGAFPTQTTLPNQPGWLNQRTIEHNGETLHEFYGPLKGSQGDSIAMFRFAYHSPSFALHIADLPRLAMLVLPVLFLLPIWLFLQNRSVKPLHEISEKLAALASNQDIRSITLSADGELRELLNGVNDFLSQTKARIADAEARSQKLVTEEKFLSYRAERYESILQTVPDGILILDEDSKVVFANQHLETMFAVNRLDIMSTEVDAWCDYEPFLDYVRASTKQGQLAMADVRQMSDPRSNRRTLSLSTHPLFFSRAATSNSGLLILLRDVSQEVAAKQSRADFVGSVSHEIKAPLNTIGLYSQMLESNGDDPEFIAEAHNTITQEVDRMTRLINSLLSLTQIEMGTFEIDQQRTHLREITRECIDMLDHGDDKARIKVDIEDHVSHIMVDKELFRVAVSNLFTNALKYSPADKEVHVTIEETPESVKLNVADQGTGMSEEEQSRIFDKFYRCDSNAQTQSGHGLGLSIAQEIVALHHGTIGVESELGTGSRFTIEIWKNAGAVKHAI